MPGPHNAQYIDSEGRSGGLPVNRTLFDNGTVQETASLSTDATRPRGVTSTYLLWTPMVLGMYGATSGQSHTSVALCHAFPFFAHKGRIIDEVALVVTLAAVGESVRGMIWRRTSPEDIAPGPVLLDLGYFDIGATGWKIKTNVGLVLPYTGIYIAGTIPTALPASSHGPTTTTSRLWINVQVGSNPQARNAMYWTQAAADPPPDSPRTGFSLATGGYPCMFYRCRQT